MMNRAVCVLLGLAVAVAMMWCSSAATAAESDFGQPILVLDPEGHKALIRDVAFTPDGRYLVSAGDDKAIRVWDLETGKTERFIRGQIGPSREGTVYTMALSPDARLLAAAGWMGPRLGYQLEELGRIRLHDFASGSIIKVLESHRDTVLSLAFSPDNTLLASGSFDKTVKIWDVASGTVLRTLKGHKGEIYGLAFSPDGRRLASASDDHTLILWDAESGKRIARMTGHEDRVRSVGFSPDGEYLASGSWDHKVRLWDGVTGAFIKVLADQKTQVDSLTFSPDGTRILTGVGWGPDYLCHVFSVPDGQELLNIDLYNDIVLGTAISADGRLAATAGGHKREIHIWEMDTGQVLQTLTGKGAAVFTVAFSEDGSTLAWGQTSDYRAPNWRGPLERTMTLKVGEEWQFTPGSPVEDSAFFLKPKETFGPYRLTSSKGGSYGYNALLKLLKNDKEIALVERNSNTGYQHRAYTFTPDGQYVVSAGDQGELTLYSVPKLDKVADLIGHESDVFSVSCSPDGVYLASSGVDQTIRLWNLEEAARGGIISPLFTLFPTRDGKEWLAWTPEGYFIGSDMAARFVGYQLNKGIEQEPDFVKNDQLEQLFYRPDLVMAKTRGVALPDLPDISTVLAAGLPPVVEILDPAQGDKIDGEVVTVNYAVQDRGRGVGTVRVFLNGTAVETENVRGIPLQPGPRKTAKSAVEISLEPGRENQISIVAYDSKGELRSEEASVTVRSEAAIRKPRFLALIVGINKFYNPDLELLYARPDAEAVAQVLRERVSPDLFEDTQVKLLVDEKASIEGVREGLDWMKTEARPEDVVVIYMATHGEMREGRYFLLTASTDYIMTEDLERTSLLEQELRDRLGEIPASKKLLLLDTCKSGKLVLAMNRGLAEGTTLELLARAVGTYVMAASTEVEYALEGYRDHGLFTLVLLDGLNGKADLDENGVVEVDELKLYVRKEVPALAQKLFGRRQLPVATGRGQSFPLVQAGGQ